MLWRVSSSGSREQSGHMKGRRKRPGSTFCRMDKETRSAASARTIGRQECDRRRAVDDSMDHGGGATQGHLLMLHRHGLSRPSLAACWG